MMLIIMLINISIIIHPASDLKARIRADVLNEAGLLLRNSNGVTLIKKPYHVLYPKYMVT